MKLFFITLFSLSFLFFHAQKETQARKNKLLFNIDGGFNIANHNKEGGQIGLNFGKNKHIFRLHFINNKNDYFSTEKENAPTNAILNSKSYSFMYGYIYKKSIFNLIPSVGIIVGQEFFRTKEVDYLGYYGCGNGFGGSCDSYHHFQYHYDETEFVGAIISFIFQININNGFAGLNIEHYAVINNHNRFDFGVTIGISLGKMN